MCYHNRLKNPPPERTTAVQFELRNTRHAPRFIYIFGIHPYLWRPLFFSHAHSMCALQYVRHACESVINGSYVNEHILVWMRHVCNFCECIASHRRVQNYRILLMPCIIGLVELQSVHNLRRRNTAKAKTKIHKKCIVWLGPRCRCYVYSDGI